MIHLTRPMLTALAETAAWLTGRRQRIRIVGASMEPTLHDGEFVLVDTRRQPDPGELVLASHPTEDLWVVKRAVRWIAGGGLEVASDNPAVGSDSRTWGPLPAAAIRGTVTVVLGDAHRKLSGQGQD